MSCFFVFFLRIIFWDSRGLEPRHLLSRPAPFCVVEALPQPYPSIVNNMLERKSVLFNNFPITFINKHFKYLKIFMQIFLDFDIF